MNINLSSFIFIFIFFSCSHSRTHIFSCCYWLVVFVLSLTSILYIYPLYNTTPITNKPVTISCIRNNIPYFLLTNFTKAQTIDDIIMYRITNKTTDRRIEEMFLFGNEKKHSYPKTDIPFIHRIRLGYRKVIPNKNIYEHINSDESIYIVILFIHSFDNKLIDKGKHQTDKRSNKHFIPSISDFLVLN